MVPIGDQHIVRQTRRAPFAMAMFDLQGLEFALPDDDAIEVQAEYANRPERDIDQAPVGNRARRRQAGRVVGALVRRFLSDCGAP